MSDKRVFRVGQLVRRKESFPHEEFSPNESYQIKKVKIDRDYGVLLTFVNEHRIFGEWMADRFELVESTKTSGFKRFQGVQNAN